ncbi:MAG: DUF445 family protein [Cyanobacteriota bacterium]
MDLELLIINIFAGAFVGYTTKMLAINMLFKKYPIIGGAEIIKDRENLAIAVSELVEERLIKPETLVKEFEKENFKDSFQNLIKHIIDETIIKNITNKNIELVDEISGFDKTSDNLKHFLFENEENILPNALKILYETIEIKDFLSPKQLETIIQKLIEILSESVTLNISGITDKFYEELEKIKLDDVLTKDEVEKVFNSLISDDLYKKIQKNIDSNINNYSDNLYEILNLDDLIKNIEISVKNKTLFELIGDKNSDNSTLNSIVKRLLLFINSEKGNLILQDFISTFIDVLKKLDIPLSILVTRNIENTIIKFIEKNMPEVVDRLEIWLEINKKEVEAMLNQSIEEHLESENMIKQLVGNIFSEEITNRYKFVENTITEVKKLIYESNDSFLKSINRFLDNTQVSDLAKFLEEKIIDKKVIFDIVSDIINKYLPKINFSFFDSFMNKKLSEIWIIDEISFPTFFRNYVYTFIISKIRSEFILTDKLKNYILLYITSNYKNISGKGIKKYASKEFFDSLNPIITNFVNDKNIHKSILKTTSESIPKLIGDKSIDEIIPPDVKQEIVPKFSNLYKNKISDFLFRLKKAKVLSIYSGVSNLYAKLAENKSFSKQLTNTLVELMNTLIRKNKLLDGKIKLAIKESFSKFTDDELKVEMNSFMGKELQPIKLLGAFLGALIGVGMYYLSFVPNYGDYVKGYWALLTYSLSYGITEIATNWVAIKMLFKPYKAFKIPILNIDAPFTPGVFAKNKKALAESMVNFIDKKLLSKENMIEILERYKKEWEDVIKKALASNDYNILDKAIYDYTKEHYDSSSNIVLDIAFTEISNNKETITNYLVQEIKKIYLDDKDLEFIKNEISSKINESKNYIGNFLDKDFFSNNDFLNKTINTVVSDKLIKEINKIIFNGIKKLPIDYLKDKKLEDIIAQNKDIIRTFSNKKIHEHFTKDEIKTNKKNIISYFQDKLKQDNVQELIFNYIESNLIKKDITSDKKIKDIFDGKIITTIIKELDGIIDSISDYIVNIAKSKKDLVSQIIISDIEKKGMFETMLVRFGGVRNDIKKVVEIVIENKIPEYIFSKKEELKIIIKSYIENSFSKISLNDLGLKQDVFASENIRNILQKNVFGNEKLFSVLNILLGNLANDLVNNLTIKECIELININSTEDLKIRLKNEFEILNNYINTSEKLINSTDEKTIEILNKVLLEIAENISFEKIIDAFSNNKKSLIISSLIDFIYSSEVFAKVKNDFLELALNKVNKEFYNFLDYETLNRDLSRVIHNLTSDKNSEKSIVFKNHVKSIMKDITFKFVEIINKNLEKQTKSTIENIFVESLVESLRINNREILEPIDFGEIIRKEIHVMEAERIEAMFGFAKPIFALLVWYGALGGIIGLFVGIFEASR